MLNSLSKWLGKIVSALILKLEEDFIENARRQEIEIILNSLVQV